MEALRSLCNRGGSEHVDAGKEEQPHHVDEVPIPRRRLESEMTSRCELSHDSAEEAHRKEDRADDHVKAVKSGRHEEGRAVDGAEIARSRGQTRMRDVCQRRERRTVEAETER